jgi:mannitol/fructose-specific phosphotransferase system IIA component
MPSTIKMLKKDAQVPITVGAGFIQKLQSMLVAILADRTEEEITVLQNLIEQGQEPSEPWMDHVQILMSLLNELDNSAIANGLTIDKEVDDILTESES